MQELQQLIKSLSKSEVKFIKHYYRFNIDKKRHFLFNLVLEEKVQTDDEAAKLIYGTKGAAYSHLKNRLRKDLLNLLLFEEGEKKANSESLIAEINVDRTILQSKILISRNVRTMAEKLLQQAAEQADKFELLPEKLGATELLSKSVGLKKGMDAYSEISASVDADIKMLASIFKARDLHAQIVVPNYYKRNEAKEFVDLAASSVEELKKLYKESGSKVVAYYYYTVAIFYFNMIENFKDLLQNALELLSLIEANVAINSQVRLLNANLQVYGALMNLHRYEEALAYAWKAEKFTRAKGPNELLVKEYQFLVLSQLNKEADYLKCLNFALKHNVLKKSKFEEGKWVYYKAIYLFKHKQFNEALIELQKENELLKDKSGWLFGHKLLEIMCYMELEEFDMIEFRIEALRKLLQRQKDKNITRVKTIFSILSTFTKTGASYKKTYLKEKANFELLIQQEDAYNWDPLGFEVIRFDAWFLSKFKV